MAVQAITKVRVRTVVDRAALRAGLQDARAAFHRLLERDGNRWHEKSETSAWSRGEVLVHLTWALEQLPQEVDMARQGRGMFNMPKWIADPGSYWMIRWQARRADPESLRRRYDAAMDAAIAKLDTVPESDWGCGAPFYGHGFHSVARLFEVPAEHIVEHGGQE